jgi:glycosyltransferase involved in cell wall biosynthesis
MAHEEFVGDDPFAGHTNIANRTVRMRGSRLNLWQDLALPLLARRVGATVIHAPANTAPFFPLARLVVTIHDLIPLEIAPQDPNTHDWVARVKRGAQLARRIITPSQWSRQQIVRHLGVSSEKIVVNHWAPDTTCRVVTDPAVLNSVRLRYGIPDGRSYVLGFGGADPRKNTRRIMDAWSRLPERVRASSVLLLVGNQEPAWSDVRELARTLGISESCNLHGFADERDIPALLSAAHALCYPSLSEGFGLPILDAFACRTPVITSNGTSLAEVAADAALTIDPTDVDAIRDAMCSLLTDDRKRDALRTQGEQRVSAFSWDRCAELTAQTMEAAAGD